MALSMREGSPGQEPLNGEEDVLCELNAEFRRSKSELIHRFLKDQEELNKKFSEYELDSDNDEETDDCSSNDSGKCETRDSHQKQEIFDVLQDLEDKDIPDNLSTASAVNSSSDGRSLSDCGGYESYEGEVGEEDRGNWNTPEHQTLPPESYADDYYDRFSRQAHPRATSEYEHPIETVSPPQPQPRKSKKKESQSRKVKKVLVKKNVRPQTSMGVRALPDEDEYLYDAQNSEIASVKTKNSIGPHLTYHDALRLKKISWTSGAEGHPEMGRLSISASIHKLPPRSHTPGGRLKTSSSPLIPTSALTFRGSPDSLMRTGSGGSNRGNNSVAQNDISSIRRSKAPLDLLELSRSATPVRADSSMSNCSRFSVELTPDQIASYRIRHGTPTTSGPHLMRSVYSSDRGSGGRILMSPTLADVKSGKRRPIAVLKLPPLDSGVVNKAIGARLEPSGRQPPFVSTATAAKSNTVVTPSV